MAQGTQKGRQGREGLESRPRASGTVEAREAAAQIDDLKKLMGHSEKSNTAALVYDRAKLAAHRRVGPQGVPNRLRITGAFGSSIIAISTT